MLRGRTAIGLLALAAVVVPGSASAAAPQPAPATSSISEYVEQVPAATGAVPVGHGSGTVARLSPAAKAALAKKGGSDAPELSKIATDPRYGAPAAAPRTAAQPVSNPTPAATKASAASSKPTTASKPAATSSTPRTTPTANGRSHSHPQSTTARAPAPAASATPGPLSAAATTLSGRAPWVLLIALCLIAGVSVVLARRDPSR